MIRDIKVLVTFKITIDALQIHYIACKIGYDIGYWISPELDDSGVKAYTFGIFFTFIMSLFPTYKLNKINFWNN